jgi:CelD/BcsL family acetyltransferase involved in cellulose biosynthesis
MHMVGMTAAVIEDVERFTALTPQWNELLRASSADCPFLTAEWLQAWWAHLGGARALRIMTVGDEDHRLIAIAPLMAVDGPLGMFRRLEFLGTGHAGSDYLDVIVRRGHEREGLQALVAAIRQEQAVLCLSHVADTSLALVLGERLAEVGWTVRRTPASVCPIVTLDGQTWDSYLASLGASHRANFRRRLRALTNRFDMRFELVDSEPARGEALAALVRFHEQRFGARGSTAFVSPALCAFHDDATGRAHGQGWLRLFVLRLNGTVAAVMYGFSYNRRFSFYQHGFDSQYDSFSVGTVLMGLTIQAALEEGALEFDMLYGTEAYKWLWARDQRPLTELQLYPPRLGGIVYRRTAEAERGMRAVARRILAIGAARAS